MGKHCSKPVIFINIIAIKCYKLLPVKVLVSNLNNGSICGKSTIEIHFSLNAKVALNMSQNQKTFILPLVSGFL